MRMRDTLARLAAQRTDATWPGAGAGRLAEFTGPAINPGALDVRAYIPESLPAGAPLVVILHGCTQTAAGYDAGTGWSQLADRAGIALLFPEQRRANNPNLCFNWFQPADIARHGGEAESIAQMVEAAIERHAFDRQRVFVTGLSAGGAMAASMLAAYPDVFAGGAIIGGLPHGCATGIGQALERMAGRNRHGAGTGADIAATASGLVPECCPTVSIWHGAADTTVVVGNMDDLVSQWCGVHGVDLGVGKIEFGANWTHSRWTADGRTVVESWRIAGMGHGVPIDPAGPDGLGSAGPYMLPVGVNSTALIAQSWGLLPEATGAAKPTVPVRVTKARAPIRPTVSVPARPQPANNIQAVIEDALRSAGLMK